MADSVALPVEIKYEKVPSVSPKYKYLKVPLNNIPGGSILDLCSGLLHNSSNLCLALMYTIWLNRILLKSSIAAQGDGNYSILWADTQTIADQISFSDAAGNNLLNLQSADKYVKIMRKVDTPYDEYVTHTALDRLAPSGLAATTNYQPTLVDTTAFDTFVVLPRRC